MTNTISITQNKTVVLEENIIEVISIAEQGVAGVGVPTGGTSGQVLTKHSNSNFDTEWKTPTGGGSVPLSGIVTRTSNLISSVQLIGGATYNVTRDINNLISTIANGLYLWTFTRDINKKIVSWQVTDL